MAKSAAMKPSLAVYFYSNHGATKFDSAIPNHTYIYCCISLKMASLVSGMYVYIYIYFFLKTAQE